MLWDALQAFLPCIMQSMPPIAAQLEQFRTETLGKYLPAEKKEAAEANSYMDSLIGLDNVQLPEVPVVNSRAGLYIYLSAAVSSRNLLGFLAVSY
jgi:mediator of RNA polymerase II transcription subunit 5